jgi:putative ABC transport system permease protein
MLRNYFKIALRNLNRNKVFSFINIGGLAVGMAVAILIGLWIYDELSYNKYHQNYDRIAQVKAHVNYSGTVYTIASQSMPLGTQLRSSFRNDFKYVVLSTGTEQHILSSEDKKFNESGKYMQPEAPEMLTLKMLRGNRSGLQELNSILLSESLAKKLFGATEPMDQKVNIDNKSDMKVTGVYEDLPYNSEFKDLAFIAPLDFYLSSNVWARNKQNDWNNIWLNIYTQINPNTDFQIVSARIKDLMLSHVNREYDYSKPVLFLHPMNKWHLYSKFENGVNVTSEQLQFVWFYGTIGVFVLLLACINFMNLSTARSEKRAKEVGIRKAIGSVRSQLISQFFSESFLVAILSFLLSLILVQLTLPWFNEVADKKINLLWANALFWLAGIAFTIFTGLLAGSYPALYLSSFNPAKVLKGPFRVGRFASIPRKVLVVLQFTVSITLIIGTIIVYRQIQFAKNRPAGYSQNDLVQIQMSSPDFQGKYDILRNELKNTGVVTEIAESASPVTSIWSTNKGFSWNNKNTTTETDFGTIAVTQEYGKTIGWQFVDGRDFSKEFASDSSGFVINEAAAKLMGLKNPVGETIKWDRNKNISFKILGVVKDMVMESPFKPSYPTLFFILPGDGMNYILIRIDPRASVGKALTKIESVFKKLIPSASFEYKFVNDEYAAKFTAEERIGKLAGFFAILAIFISCLGLFGLASFVAEQRTKEIGVRKVLGASLFNLWRLLSKDFVVLVLISLFIATPIAYYFMYTWLQSYQYRTELSWWIFASAGAGALLITLLTISFQGIKAAVANPVKSLRAE